MLKEDLRNHLRASYSESDLKSWFDPLTLDSSASGDIAIHFPHPLFSGWIDGEKRSRLEQALLAMHGPGASVHFHNSRFENRHAPHQGNGIFPVAPVAVSRPKKDPSVSDGNAFSRVDRSEHNFDSFLFNKKNEFPFSLAADSCRDAGKNMHIPFVICGKGVCGKTHLLRAMAVAISESLPPERSQNVYLGDATSMLALFENGGHSFFYEKLLAYEAVFLDDIQESGRHSALQNELVRFLDTCGELKKPLVLVAEDISQSALSAKLRSRIEGGMTITLKKPDMDIRLAYIRRLAHALRVSLGKEQAMLLAQQFHDFRLLQGILSKLAAFIARRKPEAGKGLDDVELASILEHNAESAFRPITPESVMHIVAERFGLSAKDVAGKGRNQDTVLARQISMFLCRDILGLTFPDIGRIFGGKNHATVVYSCKKIQQLRDSNNNINKLVSSLRKKCASTGA